MAQEVQLDSIHTVSEVDTPLVDDLVNGTYQHPRRVVQKYGGTVCGRLPDEVVRIVL